jgi:transposase
MGFSKKHFPFYSLSVDAKVIKKSLKRTKLLAFFANYPVSLIGIEACGGAYHWQGERI